MGLNESKGNMYDFITHTWNTVKGQCYHDCSYCYMKRWGNLKPVRFDNKELKTDLGENNFIFVGSSCDMWAENIHSNWINDTINHCIKHSENKYLIQTKNPSRLLKYRLDKDLFVACITFESNRWYSEIMGNSPQPCWRIHDFSMIENDKYITMEPILDFNMGSVVSQIKMCNPIQVNIGADSGSNNLPEPPKEKVIELIQELEKFTKVNQKKNLGRLLV